MSFSQVPKKWDAEADVIVVGGGNAGLPAAITAHDKGDKVIVLETSSGMASSLAMIAGGTPFAGTDLQKKEGIKDSADQLYDEATKVTGGDHALWRAIADRQLETYNFLVSLGAKPEQVLLAPGHLVRRSIRFEGHGPALCKILRTAAMKRGLDIRQKHHAEKLIVDCNSGRVIGVRAKTDNKVVNFRAKKAVILTTGGFVSNPALLKEFGPEYAELEPTAPPTHKGDGLIMALDVGAATAGIGMAVCPSMSVFYDSGHHLTGAGYGGILVDRDAKRFCNESTGPLDTYTIRYKNLINRDPSGVHYSIYDEAIREASKARGPEPKNEKIHSSTTIEGLAEAMGLDAKALKETLDEYNSDIEKYGYDRNFGRKFQGMAYPNQPPQKINNPPYYGIKCKICLTSMKGGIKINSKNQVMDHFGNAIPGLYAAGEICGGLMGIPSHYYTGTMTLQAFTQGRIAGDIASDEPSR